MNLDRNKYKVLEMLSKGKISPLWFPGDIPHLPYMEEYGFSKGLQAGLPAFRSQVIYPSAPFAAAAKEARGRLGEFYLNASKTPGDALSLAGTIVFPGGVVFVDNALKPGTDNSFLLRFFVFTAEGSPMFCAIEGDESLPGPLFWVSQAHAERFPDGVDALKGWISGYIADAVVLLLFKRFAHVEVVTVPPRAKVKHGTVKARNDTGVPVLYLDSKWFTTLVRSEGFKVSGHFRLQPKKVNGEWTRELIWINEFEKHGYTSPARKLRPENV